MINRNLKVIGEFYDISKYIGVVDPAKAIYESLQGGEELIVLTEDKLITVIGDQIALDINIEDIEDFNFSSKGKAQYILHIITSTDVISLDFHKKRESLRFINNILRGLTV